MTTNKIDLSSYGITGSPCPHCDNPALGTPITTAIDKVDCAYCCHTNAHGSGILICIACKEAVCPAHVKKHTALFPTHALYVKYYRLPDRVKEGESVRPEEQEGEEGDAAFVAPTGDVNNVGIVDPPAYDARCLCVACEVFFEEPASAGPHVSKGYTAVYHATPKAAVASDGGAASSSSGDADDPYRNSIVCPHTRDLSQGPSPFDPATNPLPADPATLPCHQCSCCKNNWICMTCGVVGCPRTEGGGNAHAIAHYSATGHPVVLKLGTVTSKGADMYCYACDEEVKDPRLGQHLAHFGIDMATAVKTSKSLGEMAYDLTMAADFGAICEVGADGKSLVEPVAGRAGGFMGLHNFGNTCYMNAVVQLLMRAGPFQKAFIGTDDAAALADEAVLAAARERHTASCSSAAPRQCYLCQWLKVATALYSAAFANTAEGHRAAGNNGVADALVSPAYAAEEEMKVCMYEDFVANVLPADPSARMDKDLLPRKACHALATLNGATPRDFKVLNARGSAEFLSGKQQDALEYLAYLCDGIAREEAKGVLPANPTAPFAIEAVNKKQCVSCQRVRYQRTREDILRLPTPMHPDEYARATAKLAAEAEAENKEKEKEKEKVSSDEKDDKKATKPPAPKRPRVELRELLEAFVAPKMTECRCEGCHEPDGGYFCTASIYNYPAYAILSIPREYMDPATYTTKKMDVFVDVPEVVDLKMLRGPGGLQEGEEPLPSHVENEVLSAALQFSDGMAAAAPSAPSSAQTQTQQRVEVDELALVQLLSMGIEQPTAEWALRACRNNVEAAIDYVFSHPEGPSAAEEAPAATTTAAPAPSPVAARPLPPLTDDPSQSVYDVIGMVSHVGASAVSGHYVCHLKREDGHWYLYNDEKVGKSVRPPLDLGTFYLLKRRS